MRYPVDSVIHLLNNWGQMNLYPVDNTTGFPITDPLDSDLIINCPSDSAIQLFNQAGPYVCFVDLLYLFQIKCTGIFFCFFRTVS